MNIKLLKPVLLAVILSLLFSVINAYGNEEEEKAVAALMYMYKSQIFITELEHHQELLSRHPDDRDIKLESYYHVMEIVHRFKIADKSNGSEYDEVFHDYALFLVDFGDYLVSLGVKKEADSVYKKAMLIITEGRFKTWLKVDYEVNDIDSLRKYRTDLMAIVEKKKDKS